MPLAMEWRVLGLAAVLTGLPMASAVAAPIDGGVPHQYNGTDPNEEYHAGLQALGDQKYREAKQHFERVLSVARDHPVALFRLGEAEDGLGHYRDAALDYQASLKADPNQIRAASELAVDQEHLGRHQEAVAQLEKFKQRSVACNDSCPDASDLAAAVRNIESAMPQGAASSGQTP